LRRWNLEHPRARPTPGDIVAILKAERGRQKAPQVAALSAKPAPASYAITDEEKARRAAVLAELGLRAKPMCRPGGHDDSQDAAPRRME